MKQVSCLQLFNKRNEIISSLTGVRRVAREEANRGQFTDSSNSKQKHPTSKLETSLSYKQIIYLSRKQPLRLIVPKTEREKSRSNLAGNFTDSQGYYQRKCALLLPASPKAQELRQETKHFWEKGCERSCLATAPQRHSRKENLF